MNKLRSTTRLLIDLSLLKYNILLLKNRLPEKQILFMIKANGYGHGAIPIAKYCWEERLIQSFGLATWEEALQIRSAIPDPDCKLYVFSDNHLEYSKEYSRLSIIPVISNIDDLKFFLENSDFNNTDLVIKLNTGMNRLGIKEEKIDEMIHLIRKSRTKIEHLMSHFANSTLSLKIDKKTQGQYTKFKEIKNRIIHSGIKIIDSSMANSGAIEQEFFTEENWIRLGIMLYGPTSLGKELLSESWWTGKNISQLEARILDSFPIKKGDTVGYGSFELKEDGHIAILAIGYGDGFPNRMTGCEIEYRGLKGMIVGRVNMDMIQVFFPQSQNPRFDLNQIIIKNDLMPIWKFSDESLINISEISKTIPYEIFCSLTIRVPRIHK